MAPHEFIVYMTINVSEIDITVSMSIVYALVIIVMYLLLYYSFLGVEKYIEFHIGQTVVYVLQSK